MINEKMEKKKRQTTKSLITLFLLSFPNQTNSKRGSVSYEDIMAAECRLKNSRAQTLDGM